MPTSDIKQIKQEKREYTNKVKRFKTQLNKLQNKPHLTTQKKEVDAKVNAIDYYNSLSEGEKLAFQEELKKKEIRNDYCKYLKYVYGDSFKLTKFHVFLAKLAQSIVERVEKGQKVKVCISVPPQHGKSTVLTQTLPSWFLGRNPDLRCITTAYNADIAEKFGDRPRQHIKTYGKELFGIEISDSQDNKTIWDIKDHLGGMYSTGINGSLTSNPGALIIVDDPIKNEVEANNPNIREQIWANFSTSLLTRQRGLGNAIIVIQTRWHEDDLIGRILEQDTENEWVYVNLPCILESGVDKILHRRVGETLCPELGFDGSWAESMRKALGERRFNALYQGKPFVDGGDILKRDMLRFYDKSNLPSVFEELTMSCDLSFGGKKNENDPCGIAIWGRSGGNHYLLDYIIKKLSFTETLDRIRYLCGKYPQLKGKIIEKKANGDATIEVLNREIGGFMAYDPKGNSKEDRLQLCLPYFESGNVYFPSEKVDKDFEKYTQILLKFPKVAHDEIVDITTQYLLNYQYKYSGRVNTDEHYAVVSKAFRGIKI